MNIEEHIRKQIIKRKESKVMYLKKMIQFVFGMNSCDYKAMYEQELEKNKTLESKIRNLKASRERWIKENSDLTVQLNVITEERDKLEKQLNKLQCLSPEEQKLMRMKRAKERTYLQQRKTIKSINRRYQEALKEIDRLSKERNPEECPF